MTNKSDNVENRTTMKKSDAMKVLRKLPDEFELDILIEQLIIVNKIREAIKDVKESKGIPHEKMRQVVTGWKKRSIK
ncbi:MAG: hypothetical protein HY064_16655 [Bacteroidetes bacterium]|nr:hypothetical protein [Bacteroidota bacterium]